MGTTRSKCVNVPQLLTETELLPFIISNTNRLAQYKRTSYNKNHFELINFGHSFQVEHSEISDSRPYTTSHILPQTQREEHNPSTHQEPQQFNKLLYQQPDTTALQNVPDPSETATIQNVSELSDITINNPQNLTKTNDSNILQIPVHDITQNPNNNQDQNDTILDTNQDITSTLSTSNTTITQQFQTQQTSPQNYNPPPLPPQYFIQTSPHFSPQLGSTNTQTTNTVQFQTTTPTTQSIEQTLEYTPAQKTQTQNIQTASFIIILHSNTIPNYTTSRNLPRPPIKTIPTNPQSNNLASTNPNKTTIHYQ